MKYKITADNFEFSSSSSDYFAKLAKKIEKVLKDFSPDLPLLEFVIKRHQKKEYYDGSIILKLGSHTLFGHFKAQTVDKAIKEGFIKINEELKDFKSKHFENYDEYPKKEEFFNLKDKYGQ